jgi:hypothetical protein
MARATLACSIRPRLLELKRLTGLGNVLAGREGLVGAGQHDAAHRRIGLRRFDPLHDALAQRMAQAVDRRAVERDDGDGVLDGQHGVSLPLATTSRSSVDMAAAIDVDGRPRHESGKL